MPGAQSAPKNETLIIFKLKYYSDFILSLFSWLATTNQPEGGGNDTLPTNSSKGSVG